MAQSTAAKRLSGSSAQTAEQKGKELELLIDPDDALQPEGDVVNALNDGRWDVSLIIHQEKEKGAKQYQEDSTCVYYSSDLTFLLAAVFDGHGGLNGQVASSRCAKLTEAYFDKHWRKCKQWNKEQWEKNMVRFFAYLHENVRDYFIDLERSRRQHARQSEANISDDHRVVRKASGLPVHGGTTASISVCIRTEQNKWRIVCANVGDSDVLLLARRPPTMGHNSKCKHLSTDHSPDNADEFLRIQSLPEEKYPLKLMFVYDQANVCRKFDCPTVFLKDGTKDPKFVRNPWGNNLRPTNVRYDPAVYAVTPAGVSHDITCIAMTRSLGDFYAHQFGLTATPSVSVEEQDFDKEFIVTVGSDGIWDCWKWDDFSDYVNGVMSKQENKLNLVVRTVLRHTVARAKACFGEASYDDASLVLIALRPSLFPEFREVFPDASEEEEKRDDIQDHLPTEASTSSATVSSLATSGSTGDLLDADAKQDSDGDTKMTNVRQTSGNQ